MRLVAVAGELLQRMADAMEDETLYRDPRQAATANPAALDPARRLAQCRWLTFTADQADMPSARWVLANVPAQAMMLRFDRSSLIIEACLASVGLAALPRYVADADERLVCVQPALPGVQIQSKLVVSTSAYRIPRVRHVARWLIDLLACDNPTT